MVLNETATQPQTVPVPVERHLFKPRFTGSRLAVFGWQNEDHPDRFDIQFIPRTTLGKVLEVLKIPRNVKKANSPEQFYSFMQDGRQDLLELIHALQTQRKFAYITEIHGLTNYRMARFAIDHLGFSVYRDLNDTRSVEQILEKAASESKSARGQEVTKKGFLHIYMPKEQFCELAGPEKQAEMDTYMQSLQEVIQRRKERQQAHRGHGFVHVLLGGLKKSKQAA